MRNKKCYPQPSQSLPDFFLDLKKNFRTKKNMANPNKV